MPNVNLDKDVFDRLFGLKKAYTAQTGEDASFNDLVDAAVDRLEDDDDFELAWRVKKEGGSDDSDDPFMSL